MKLSDPVTAASSYLKARDIEAAIYGQNHPDLISTEYSLAASLHACAEFASAEDAINRCLRIIRQGGQQARAWRHRALRMAIIIDLEDKSPSASTRSRPAIPRTSNSGAFLPIPRPCRFRVLDTTGSLRHELPDRPPAAKERHLRRVLTSSPDPLQHRAATPRPKPAGSPQGSARRPDPRILAGLMS